MSDKEQDFELYAGSQKVVDFTLTDADGALNLTGGTFAWTMHGRGVDLDKVPVIEGVPTNGICRLTLDEIDTASIQPGTYYHELQITDASSDVSVLATGVVTLKGGSN